MNSITEAARAASLFGVGIGAHPRHLAGTIVAAVAAWHTDRALAHLNTHMLRDIGMEGTRPFERTLPTGRPEFRRRGSGRSDRPAGFTRLSPPRHGSVPVRHHCPSPRRRTLVVTASS